MGHPQSGTAKRTPTSGRLLRDRSHCRQRPAPRLLSPPPQEVPQEFVRRLPTETTIIRLCRASPADRTLLAHRVIDRFLGLTPPKNPNETSGTEDSIAMEAVQAAFLCVVAIRAGMHSRGRNGGDEFVLRTMQNILTSCVTRENARDVATMVQDTRIDHIGGSLNDRRATARPIISRILAHGFEAVPAEIHEMEGCTLVTARASRNDNHGTWFTVTNMKAPKGTNIPREALVLVSYPLPRPLDWFHGSNRDVSYTEGGIPTFVDPSLLPN